MDEKKIEKEGDKKEVLVLPNRRSLVLARELDQDWKISVTLHDDSGRFRFCPFLNNQELLSHAKLSVSQQAPEVKYVPPYACIKDRFPPFVAGCLQLSNRQHTMLSSHPVTSMSLWCCLQCAKSNLKQKVELYHKLVILPFYHHCILSSVQCESCRTFPRSHFSDFPTRTLAIHCVPPSPTILSIFPAQHDYRHVSCCL